jgi:hypothetical protein
MARFKEIDNFKNPLVKEINEKINKLLKEYGRENYKPLIWKDEQENYIFILKDIL